ncbi:hypothetical protein OG723_44590 (plasmid) [Streptomyces sp. NBC_01278]|uniref:hypothetical protein n=1 Tax=Streptomyces sp. NBC_01278 TaxID=2903809 RepID=UPI002E35EE15|nr:hypothetical protein [Streptomyces sp. NBC_01278]
MSVNVPTSEDHTVLAAAITTLTNRVTKAEQAIAAAAGARPLPAHVLRPEDFGAVAGSDCTAAFTRMMETVDKGLQPDPGGGVPVARHTILLGPGPYILSKPWMTEKAGRAQGLTIRGMGKRSSEIVWTGSGPLLTNRDRWMGVRWEHLSFRSTNPEASFLYSYSTGAAQDWGFTNCEWRGSWKYGIGLDGPEASNTNSEWRFEGCHVGGAYDVAWLWSGMSPQYRQQDQFLNFWISDCKIEFDWGDAFRFDRGGFIVVTGGSWIIKGERPDGGVSRYFNFPLAGHADSVQHLTIRGARFELRNATSQVIRSRWNGGHITFSDCSDTALGFKPYSKDLTAHEYDFTAGAPQVRYEQCDLVGRHRIWAGTGDIGRGGIVYDQCTHKNHRVVGAFLDTAGAGTKPQIADLNIEHRADGDGFTS